MPIERHTEPSGWLTILTATGELRPETFIRAVKTFADDPPAKKILWDFREAYPAESFTLDDMKRIAALVKATIGSQADGKTAYVATSDLAFGVSRMYQAHLQMTNTNRETKVFRSMEEALRWLEEAD